MEQFISAINGYAPRYKAKVKRVVETINHELSKRKQFRINDLERYLEFDCSKHIRLLCRRGFLAVVPGAEGDEGANFRRLSWPPPGEFLEGDGDVIGLAYFLQKWFRFNLQDWISKRSRELESKDGVYSLEGWDETRAGFVENESNDHNLCMEQVVSSDGDYTNADRISFAADMGMNGG